MLKKKVEISLEVAQHQVTINIDDDGQGIPEIAMEAIFEPFSTLHEAQSFGKHIGLGLAIAKSIVELHNGKINVANRSNGGARFSIVLPKKSSDSF